LRDRELRNACRMSRSKTSAGLLPYRLRDGHAEVLIAHMGGPLWANKDEGAWSIVKGEYDESREDAFAAALREFAEETGHAAPEGEAIALGEIRQRSGKRVVAWAIAAELDPATVHSNTFSMEWPPRSGRQQEFAEIDRVAWVDPATARRKLVAGQAELVDALERCLGERAQGGRRGS
jgi:predicted NUDIX family NTP pyrophosphohydrolase